ncbi:Hypothetical_protein [Hexamita inflata]|uniref:Hypothetical_protein n=1 Tax=Hexamita inflata TaxID=28002 RepID=A0AA86QCF6_9EUKA|nr:Hypothetical protein HINF_LOCUS41247 [Hexamita inflata]
MHLPTSHTNDLDLELTPLSDTVIAELSQIMNVNISSIQSDNKTILTFPTEISKQQFMKLQNSQFLGEKITFISKKSTSLTTKYSEKEPKQLVTLLNAKHLQDSHIIQIYSCFGEICSLKRKQNAVVLGFAEKVQVIDLFIDGKVVACK